MALRVEETKLVTIDNQKLAVEELPEEAQKLIPFYDDWKQRELELRSHLLMAQTAMQGIANQIALIVKRDDKENEDSQEEIAEEGEV